MSNNKGYSSKSAFQNNSSSHYYSENGKVSRDMQASNELPQILSIDDEQVNLHPLIIANDAVVCMPEVNKVLRTVYQVLSQANYYLSKHGISSRRFSGAQLIKIKMLGILNHDAKVCSYILQHEAERIFDSFDLTGSSRKSQKIIWMDPILLDENSAEKGPEEKKGSNLKYSNSNPVDLQTFELGNDTIVCAPDIQKVIQTHFNQGATTGYYFSKLGIVPFKFIHSAHLDKVKELGIIKKSAVHCTYVSKHDATRVFEAYGMTEDDLKKKINWLPSVSLDNVLWQSKWPQSSIKSERVSDSTDNSNNDWNSVDAKTSKNGSLYAEDSEEKKPSVKTPFRVNLFIVDNKEVVCMPDIHKVVQSVHGSSIQVNYYLNKLHVKKKRFCFAHLKELKTRGVLQGNATYCTYIPKAEAEKIFQIYSLMGDQKVNGIEWTEPLRLDKLGSYMTKYENNEDGNSAHNRRMDIDAGLKVPAFIVDGQEVICTPDVHKIVDYLEEQSASLDYHFRKLGISKQRYTYSQLHQLRRLQIIKRPTVCTYIRRTDVEQLLLMYATDRNRMKMQQIQWLEPVPLLSSEHGPQRTNDSPNSNVDTNSRTEPSAQEKSPETDYAVSDLYKVYIGEKLNSDHERYPDSPETPTTQRHQKSLASCPITASAQLQSANPHIDCPIVIPSADFDPTMCSSSVNIPPYTSPDSSHDHSKEISNGGQSNYLKRQLHEDHNEDGHDFKKAKGDYRTVEKLLEDLHRKETELRCLHDAYQREISIERDRRLEVEKELEILKDQLSLEQEARRRFENNVNLEPKMDDTKSPQ